MKRGIDFKGENNVRGTGVQVHEQSGAESLADTALIFWPEDLRTPIDQEQN